MYPDWTMESNCRDMPLACFNRNLYVCVVAQKNNEVLSSRQDPEEVIYCLDLY